MDPRPQTGGPGTRGVALALGSTLALALLAMALPSPAAAADGGFAQRPLPVADGRLFDLGVSDYDEDGTFEVFSVNHKFLGTLIEGQPGSWESRMAPTDLSPTPEFPGFEDLLHPPEVTTPGLYIYAESRTRNEADNPEDAPLVHIVAHRVNGIPLLPERARGTVRLPSPSVAVVRRDGANVGVRRQGSRTVVRFDVAEQGHIVLRVRKVDLPPIEFEIAQAPLLARTFVGAYKVPAAQSNFTLRLIDRHGIAWVDTNYDAHTDAFIVRGGLGGRIAELEGLLSDELLRYQPGRGVFENRVEGTGLVKGGCRARQAASIDYDRDGRLDLFASCKGSTPKLYRALPSGGYRSRSRPLRRAGARGNDYRWVDLFGSSRPELVAVGPHRVEIFRSRGTRRWRSVQTLRSLNAAKRVHGIAVGDYDRDGDADLMLGARSGNTLLVNRGRRMRVVRPSRVGLPRRGTAVSWVDYDNDGRLDLHALPGGLYRQLPGGRFRRTGLARGGGDPVWGIANWFDYDGDGLRDVAMAARTNRKPRVKTKLLRNLPSGGRGRNRGRNHWLQLDLRGSAGNRQAVGARVVVDAGGRRQVSWVGSSDTSRYSQGHYRVYFGLGRARRARRVAIRWPAGGRTILRDVRADRRLVVRRQR